MENTRVVKLCVCMCEMIDNNITYVLVKYIITMYILVEYRHLARVLLNYIIDQNCSNF